MNPTSCIQISFLHRWALLLALALVSATGMAAEIDDKSATFNQLADKVLSKAITGKVDVPAAQKDLATMVDLAAWFASQYKSKFPAGAKTMDFMLAQKGSLAGMTLAAIDEGFEADAITKTHGKELGIDLTDENNEHFGNVIDLFVHPATASIVLGMWAKDNKPDQLKRAVSELQEVKEHCQKVVAKLTK